MLSNAACSHSPTHLPPCRLAVTPQTYKTSMLLPRLDEAGHGVGLRLLKSHHLSVLSFLSCYRLDEAGHGVGLRLLESSMPFMCALTPPPSPSLHRLDEVGHGVGLRLLEVLAYRERGQRRETRLLDMLKFVHRWAH